MKIFLLIAFICSSLYGLTQGWTPMSSVPNSELFKDRSKIYLYDEAYIIHGKKVVGFPFLYREWLNGVITTEDGRVFSDYKLKYDAFHQTIFFLNGMDSLEVSDPIREFTLMVPQGDSLFNCTFIQIKEFQKGKKSLYYELMLQHAVFQLLRFSSKSIADAGKSLPVADGRKIFQLDVAYYLYHKNSGKLVRLNANGSNIAEALGLVRDQIEELNLTSYDFTIETELVRFFKSYFSKHSN